MQNDVTATFQPYTVSPGEVLSDRTGTVSTDVQYAAGLMDNPSSPSVPMSETNHLEGCGCHGCSSMSAGARDPAATDAPVGTIGDSAVSAPAQLEDMAHYLANGFWTDLGTVPREFNMTNSGLNPKNGVLHYNVTGYSNAGGALSDSDGLTSARASLVRDVLDLYGDVLGISFVETTSSDTSFTDLFFRDTDAGRAFANSAGFSAGIQYSWINISQDWSGGTSTYNDYTLQTIFHEVGHALGLGHQGLYNGTGAYPGDADFDNDSWQATMMSYFSQTENTTIPASFAFLQTPMAVDWMALQQIYGNQSAGGVDFGIGNAFTGDTVYGFNTNITAAASAIWSQFSTFANRTASTIVDGGGIDTLDVSGYSANQLINLRPTSRFDTAPSISDIGGLSGNLTLAEGTIIENAVGGSGNDTFFGNDADNVLTGNGGNDTFNDSAGADTYNGGNGIDTVNFLGQFASYSFSISGTFLAVMNVVTDLVSDTVEFLGFSDQVLDFQDLFDAAGGNTAPMALDDAYTTDADSALSGTSILANDSDADGDALTVSTVNGAAVNVGTQIALPSGALLTVNADGTFEFDPNGAFAGTPAGDTATDSFSYTASDASATSDAATVMITVNGTGEIPPPDPGTPIGQSGVVTVSQAGADDWYSVAFDTTIRDAVVVLGPATHSDGDPLTTRVRNVTDTGFEFQIDEWDYLDGIHGLESIGWLAISAGTHLLDSGETIIAASAAVGTGTTAVSFGRTLDDALVLAEVSSVNGASAVASRISDVTPEGFSARLQQQEAGGTQSPMSETLSWIAIETGTNSDFEAFITPKEVRGFNKSYGFASDFATAPVLLADMQTAAGLDTATTRLAALDASTMALFIEEEQSADGETQHAREAVGVVALPGGLIYTGAALNSAPEAADDTATVTEGAPILLDVLANDSDAEGDALTVTNVGGQSITAGQTVLLSSGAQVTLNLDQRLTYNQNGAFDAMNTGQTALDAFAYTVADAHGATATASVSVTVQGVDDEPTITGVIGQAGTATVSQNATDLWHSIAFDTTIENAMVVLGPATDTDGDPLTTRVRNVTDSGFEFQIDEWDYLDGVHGAESIGWLAISEGTHTLSTGQTIIASQATVGASFTSISFDETLTNAVVFAEVTSVNGAEAVTTRIRDVTSQGFDTRIQEEEAQGAHQPETVSWIAFESSGAAGPEVVRTGTAVDSTADSFLFNQSFDTAPVVIADMQTCTGNDPATLRLAALDAVGLSVFVEEEASADAETEHVSEVAGYAALEEGLIYLDNFVL